jgi:hypothetical protein
MSPDLVIRRRRRRASPLRARRMGRALYAPAGAAAGQAGAAPEFPGIEIAEPEGARGRVVSGSVAAALHAALIGALLLIAWLAPVEEIEELIEVELLREDPKEAAPEKPAPAPRVVAESSGAFNPAPMAVAPQVVSPAVIQRAAPVVAARELQMESLGAVQAPREVPHAAPVVDQARAYQSSVQVTASPIAIDAVAPAIRGPIETQAPSGGVLAGPRQVVSAGDTVGIADPQALGSGSAVREGIASSRDVLGAKTGARAEVNWAVGSGNLRGSGGDGTGPGGVSLDDCMKRAEVQSYMSRVRNRMLQRWALPSHTSANQSVTLRFRLDPAGTASSVEVVASADPALGQTAVSALRSASPFENMSDPVRCLAGTPLVATFKNPSVAAN